MHSCLFRCLKEFRVRDPGRNGLTLSVALVLPGDVVLRPKCCKMSWRDAL